MESLDRVGRVDDDGIRVSESELAELLLPFGAVKLVEHAVKRALIRESSVRVDLHEIDPARSREINERVSDEAVLLLRRQSVAHGESRSAFAFAFTFRFSHCRRRTH